MTVGVFGIVNVTRDSFSDGGRFLAPAAAIAHGERLLADGADVLDLGAESTHPDAEDVPADEEIARLSPVVDALLARGAVLSIDTVKPVVMAALLARGVQWLNDVAGFRSEAAMAVVAAAPTTTRVVAMFSRCRGPRADRPEDELDGLLPELRAFAVERVAAFARAGVTADRLVIDPGMGFFLGRTAAPSLLVLRELPTLAPAGVELLVSVSRKSLVGEITGQPVAGRGPGSLAAELWAARHGARWIRTHEPAAFRSAWAVERAIAGGG
jgi:dihydropteroate synthase type 2